MYNKHKQQQLFLGLTYRQLRLISVWPYTKHVHFLEGCSISLWVWTKIMQGQTWAFLIVNLQWEMLKYAFTLNYWISIKWIGVSVVKRIPLGSSWHESHHNIITPYSKGTATLVTNRHLDTQFISFCRFWCRNEILRGRTCLQLFQ